MRHGATLSETILAITILGLLLGILACLGMFVFVHWTPGESLLGLPGVFDVDHFNREHVKYITFSPDTKDIPTNVWMAVWTFLTTLVVTVGVSLVTRPKPVSELKNLVFGETDIPSTAGLPLWKKPVLWGFVLLAVCIVLNIIFW